MGADDPMRIGIVNLVTRSSEILSNPASMLKASDLRPRTDADLHIVEMGRRLAARGHEVKIFVSDAFKPLGPSGGGGDVQIEYLPTRLKMAFPPSLAPLTPSLASRLVRERLDVVQSAELFQPGTVFSWFGSDPRNSRFLVWQELDVMMRYPMNLVQRGFYGTVGKAISEKCTAIIPRSASARNHLMRQGIPEGRISEVVHSGVDTKLFRPMNKEKCRAKLGLEDREAVLLAVSRLDWIKGLDQLIRAMAGVVPEIPDSTLVVQGNGPEYPHLVSLVERLGLKRNVMFVTQSFPHSQMTPLYNVADVFAITSRIDLFPFVAIESIACAVPLATSFGRGLRTDIIEPGGGVMLPPDPAEMGIVLTSLLQDPERLKALGRAGRNIAEKEFDFEVCTEGPENGKGSGEKEEDRLRPGSPNARDHQ